MDAGVGDRLSERARAAGILLTEPLREALLAYYQLLTRWNAKINLTSLRDLDEAIDRLLLEPVAAARALPAGSRLMDLGSGGGSPGIPLALALGSPSLVMVESRGRKAAFLREAARTVGVLAIVEEARFEELPGRAPYRGMADVVSMRAVRMDEDALAVAASFLSPQGILALFVAAGTEIRTADPLRFAGRSAVLGRSELLTFQVAVPRGTY